MKRTRATALICLAVFALGVVAFSATNEWLLPAIRANAKKSPEARHPVNRAITKDSKGVISGEGCMNYDLDMPPYIEDMAKWLDDDKAVHPCNGEHAHQGFEVMMGLCRSVVERVQSRSNIVELIVVDDPRRCARSR